jgi:LemA protein
MRHGTLRYRGHPSAPLTNRQAHYTREAKPSPNIVDRTAAPHYIGSGAGVRTVNVLEDNMVPLLIALGVIVVLAFVVGSIYNRLVTYRNRYKNQFSQIDVQLKRRYDLIPNLVETAKAYMKHESGTLEAVISARNQAYGAAKAASANPGDPTAMKGLASAEAQLGGALGRLMMVAEQYPDLKANQNMLAIQEELTSTENRIAFARQSFNDAVTAYNTAREVFPSNVFAGMFNFTEAQLLESTESPEERKAPKVAF